MGVPRPDKRCADVVEGVAKGLAGEVALWADMEASETEKCLQAILSGEYDWDAYRLARSMDDEGWEPDAELVGILERAELLEYEILDKLVRRWVADNGIRPEHAVGTPVRVKDGRRKTLEGVISRIDEERGKYHVFCESEGHVREGVGTHGIVVDFESVEAVPGTPVP